MWQQRAFARDQPAGLVQPRLVLQRIEEQRQRLEERAVAEVVEPAGAARAFGDEARRP